MVLYHERTRHLPNADRPNNNVAQVEHHERIRYSGVPTAVFTVPELTRVGLLQSEATELGLDYRVKFTDTGGWYANLRVGEDCAAVKVLVNNQTDEIVGAHLFGPEYAELVNIFALAIRLGLKTADLKKMVSAYPSVGSDFGALI